jgi:hypothetical protein
MTCQQYCHSKSYCNKPYLCVKCRASHNTPAKCALCEGDHPANYKGCEHYKKVISGNNRPIIQSTAGPLINTNIPQQVIEPIVHPQRLTYAEATKPNTNQKEDTHNIFSTFLDEFKDLFNQLMQQNKIILNMLIMLINKLN